MYPFISTDDAVIEVWVHSLIEKANQTVDIYWLKCAQNCRINGISPLWQYSFKGMELKTFPALEAYLMEKEAKAQSETPLLVECTLTSLRLSSYRP